MSDGFLKQQKEVNSMTSDGYALVLHGDADASKLGGTQSVDSLALAWSA